MKNKFMVLILGGAAVMMMASSMSSEEGGIVLSSGAPVGSTNAPGELTCGKAGCHDGVNNINSGRGTLSITSLQDITKYTPGETYDITVSMEEAGVERFGYSLTALDENNNKAGTLIVTDPQRTQIFEGSLQFTGREYMTYRMIGTNPYQQGKGLWSFRWKAPEQSVGKVTFYAAGISANNDATDKGDLVYTRSLTSDPNELNIPSTPKNDVSFTVFPNPAKDRIQVNLGRTRTAVEPLSYMLYNIQGQVVSELRERTTSLDGKTITFPLKNMRSGIYYLKIQGQSVSETKQILVSK